MSIAIHSSGKFVFVADYNSGDVTVFNINADGSFGSIAYIVYPL